MTARAVFVMHKAAAHNFSSSKYKALRRMRLCSGSASSNSNRATLSVYACVVHAWAAHARTASGGQRQWFRGEKYSGFSRHTECFIGSCFMRQIEGCRKSCRRS